MEGSAKKFYRYRCRRRGSIHQQSHGCAFRKSSNNLQESKRVFTDHQRLRIPTLSRGLAEFCEILGRFRHGNDLQIHTSTR